MSTSLNVDVIMKRDVYQNMFCAYPEQFQISACLTSAENLSECGNILEEEDVKLVL